MLEAYSERWHDLMESPDPQAIEPDEIAAGWHWCPDWDDMLIAPVPEFEGEMAYCGCKLPIQGD